MMKVSVAGRQPRMTNVPLQHSSSMPISVDTPVAFVVRSSLNRKLSQL